ncbi:enolase 4 isoform 3-T3 [Thomomys bottae]
MGEEGGGRSCGITRELQKLKQQAMEYYQENDVPRRLEELLNSTFYLQPADVYGHLANYFSKLAKPPTICRVVGKSILDGLGLPALQVEIFCIIQNFSKHICSVEIAADFEVLENALPELVEAEDAERDMAVNMAVQWINEAITEELQGMIPTKQAEVDQVLRTFFANKVQEDKEQKELEKTIEESTAPPPPPVTPPLAPPPPPKKKGPKSGRKDSLVEKPIPPAEPPEAILCGSMAIGAVSLAIAKTNATLDNIPLYLNMALLKHNQEQPSMMTLPLLMGSLISCGKSSPGKLNLMKEVICIPHPGLSTKQGVEMLLEIQKQISKAMEPLPPPKAEAKKGHDSTKRGQPLITGKMSHLGCLTINYDTIEQPLLLIQGACANLGLELGVNLHLAINCAGHELMDYDTELWENLYTALGSKCYIITGSASKSISKLLENQITSIPKCHGLILRHTNQTTMSDMVEITNLTDSKRLIVILGTTEGESSDDSLVDLAVGLGVRFVKLGGPSRGERVTKYNRLLNIEEELVQNGTWGANEEHIFCPFIEDAEMSLDPATVSSKLLLPQESIFPTEVVQDSTNT